MSIRITCINKSGGWHENPYVAISQLNWINEQTGAAGRSSRDQMYDWVKAGGAGYVQHGAARAKLVPRISVNGTRYVQTVADSTESDNLLKLPECA